MTYQEWAAKLDGREYGSEITCEEEAQAHTDGVVIVFGYSDDNVELRGAMYDEIGAYGGKTVFFEDGELLINICDDEDCPYFEKMKKTAYRLKVTRPDDTGIWDYEFQGNHVPVAKFKIMEDGELYGYGMAFDHAALKEASK